MIVSDSIPDSSTIYRFVAHYCSIGVTLCQRWERGELSLATALGELDTIWPHLTRVIHHCLESPGSNIQQLWAISMCDISRLLVFRHPPQILIQWLQHALSIAEHMDNAMIQAVLRVRLSTSLFRHNNLAEAENASRDACATLEFMENPKELARALVGLGNIKIRLGTPEQALPLYERSLTLVRQINDVHGESVALGSIALAYDYLHQPFKVIEYGEQALNLARQINDSAHERNTLGNLANAYVDLADYPRVLQLYRRDLTISRALGDQYEEASTLASIGNILARVGEYELAVSHLLEALKIREVFEDPHDTVRILDYLVGLYLEDFSDVSRAQPYLEHYQALAARVNTPQTHAAVQSRMALARALEGYGDEALSRNQVYLDYMAENHPDVLSLPLCQRATIYAHIGRRTEAIQWYEQALETLARTYDTGFQYWLFWRAGVFFAEIGDRDRAIPLLEQCLVFEQRVDHAHFTDHQRWVQSLKKRGGRTPSDPR